jgi:uncharacterized repeat protein (TIGR01451 family)
MNTERPRYVRPLFQRNLFLVTSVFIALVMLAMVPLFKTAASSTSTDVRLSKTSGVNAPKAVGYLMDLLSLPSKSVGTLEAFLFEPQAPSETITTYSSDCSTPQSTFELGETVCAKTNSVDLNFQGGRWVHWLTPGLTIEYGSSTATLITANPQTFLHTPAGAGVYKVTIAETGDISQTPAVFTVVPSPNLGIYTGGCATASSVFTLGNPVCVQASNQPANDDRVVRRLELVNPSGYLFDSFNIATGSTSASHTFTLPTDASSPFGANPDWDPPILPVSLDNRGTWRVNIVDVSDSSIKTSLPITVRDPVILVSDLHISKYYTGSNVAAAGGTLQAVIWIYNGGPDPAQTVTFTDVTPANTSFQSLEHTFGPDFTCTLPAVGSPGTISCNRTSLGKDEASSFLVTYNVDNSVAGGTDLSSEATVTTTTTDRVATDNSSDSTGSVGAGSTGSCTLTCPANVAAIADTVEDVNGVPTSGKHVTFSAAEPGGTCGTLTASTPSGSFFPVGSTPVTVSSSEGAGSCTFLVIVTSSGSPVSITCPADVTVNAAADCQVAISLGTPTTTGDNVAVSSTRSDGKLISDPYPSGVTVVTWTATNSSGTESCNQTVTVNDVQPPTITIANPATVSAGASCLAAIPDLTTSGIDDNCACGNNDNTEACVGSPHITVTQDPAPGTMVGPGSHTITVVANDGSSSNNGAGNTTTALVTFTVADTTAPTFTFVPANVTANTGAGATTCDTVVDPGTATASDNCGVTVTRSPAGNTFPVGTTTITWTAKDGANNEVTATQTVTVIDNTAPTLSVPLNVTAYTGAGATTCDTVVNPGTATAGDNCAVTVTRSPSGNTFPVGTTTINWKATDSSNNQTTGTQTVTVIDNTPPTISCPANINVYLPANSTATSMAVSYPGATAADNCGGTPGLGYSQASGSVFPVGPTVVTATATDSNGNTASCQFTVTVLYNFTGFFSPVANYPTLNAVNAGRAIPVKFSLSGNKGLNIFTANNPYSTSLNCGTNDPGVDVTETLNAGGSSLSYGPDTYNYVWKTESSWAGTCRQLVLTLNDGSVHVANFKFR